MYLSPEIFLGRQYFGPPVDVWALGVVLYAMLVGRFPFSDGPQLPRDVVNGNFMIPPHLSKGSFSVFLKKKKKKKKVGTSFQTYIQRNRFPKTYQEDVGHKAREETDHHRNIGTSLDRW